MIGRDAEELNGLISECVDALSEVDPKDPVLEIELGDEGNSIIVMTQEHYRSLIGHIATIDNRLQDDVLLAIGGQITACEDTTANLQEVADYHLNTSLELVQQVVLSDEETYDGTDGVDKVSISSLGWERYLELKEKQNE